MMVTYEAMNMLFQAFIAYAAMATSVIALIVFLTKKRK